MGTMNIQEQSGTDSDETFERSTGVGDRLVYRIGEARFVAYISRSILGILVWISGEDIG